MKYGICFRNLLRIKCTKFHSNSFRFDIFIARNLGDHFFAGHGVVGGFIIGDIIRCVVGQKT